MAGLRLDAKRSVLAKVVVPGNPGESALYRRVAGIGDVARMPMGGRLADDQIAHAQELDRTGRRMARLRWRSSRRDEDSLGVCAATAARTATGQATLLGSEIPLTVSCWRGLRKKI